ncbi:hypothetical protein [Yoonia sp. MH D7]
MLNFDFNDAAAPQISAFVERLPLDAIAALIQVVPQNVDIETLKLALCDALDAYIDGALERMLQKSEKEDNRALDAVTNKAQALYDALFDVMDHPALVGRVQKAVRNLGALHNLPKGDTLADLVGNDRRSFGHFCELLVDLQIGVEDAILRKPKPYILEDIGDEPDIRLDTDEELAENMLEYRKRSAERRIPKDHALQQFLTTFKEYWQQASPHPFTEGMHHRDQGQTISNAVDVVELVLRPFDGDVTRQRIVTALRKMT